MKEQKKEEKKKKMTKKRKKKKKKKKQKTSKRTKGEATKSKQNVFASDEIANNFKNSIIDHQKKKNDVGQVHAVMVKKLLFNTT